MLGFRLSIYLSICLSTFLSIHPLIHPPSIYPPVHSPVHPPTHLYFSPNIYPSSLLVKPLCWFLNTTCCLHILLQHAYFPLCTYPFNLYKWYCLKYFTALPLLFSSLFPLVLGTSRIQRPGNLWTTEEFCMSHCSTSYLLKTSASSVFTAHSNTPLSHVSSYTLYILSYLLRLINFLWNNGPTWVPLDLGGQWQRSPIPLPLLPISMAGSGTIWCSCSHRGRYCCFYWATYYEISGYRQVLTINKNVLFSLCINIHYLFIKMRSYSIHECSVFF